MLRRIGTILLLVGALVGSGTAAARERQPVLVELFTSEGCSSCPPADALLKRLTAIQPVDGARIIALEEHVDYWNDLGWSDPWSTAQFGQRQSRYADALDRAGVYTPQMVVDGRNAFVGSDVARALHAIAAAAREPRASVALASADAGSPAGPAVKLNIGIAGVPTSARGQAAEVWLALTEDGLTSRIARGENAGRVLDHDAVVRRLQSIGTLTLSGGRQTMTASLRLAPDWRRRGLNVVAFVQARASHRIVGVTSLPLDRAGPERLPGH